MFISITNISSSQAGEIEKTTETPKITPAKKSDHVPSVVHEPLKVTKPKDESSAALKTEPSKEQETAVVLTRKPETSPVVLEVQKADVFKIPEPASIELVEVQLAKKPEPIPVSSASRKPEALTKFELTSISTIEPVDKEGPNVVLAQAPKVEPEANQWFPEVPLAKPEVIQEKEQIPAPKKKSPPKKGINT